MKRKMIETVLMGGMLAAVAAMLLCQGCATPLVYHNSKGKLESRRAAIKATGNENFAGIGVDLSAFSVLSEQPIAQLTAACIDAGLIYFAIKGIRDVDRKYFDAGEKGDKGGVVVSGSGNTVIVNQGDGNNQSIPTDNSERTSTEN